MSAYRETRGGALFAESQGPFAPEQLPNIADDVVFSREFTNGATIVTISASPVIPDRHQEYMTGYSPMPDDGYDVLVCTESRDADDDGGDTSEYEWEHVNYRGLTLPDAVRMARAYVAGIQPERDL